MTPETLTDLSNYNIHELIYKGKKTFIYKGQRKEDGKSVVLKALKNPDPASRDLEQLRHEYEVYKKLNAAQVPCVLQAYALEHIQDIWALVLEDFSGQTLYDFFNSEKLELKDFLSIAIEISQGLGDIHHQHIIHKDINPYNILVDPSTRKIKIIDFGISTFLSREIQHIMSLNMLEGTPAYLSPEQTGRLNRAMDYRTDIYSLGVTLYEVLIKQLPFQAGDLLDLIHLHIAKQPIDPHEINPNIPETVSNIIMKCLSKGAEERYQSAYGIRNDFKQCLAQLNLIGEIEIFEPGKQDVFENFSIPEKLYGREEEIKTLFSAFENVSQGATELLLVSGYSGIGKSSLIGEIQKPIEQKRGHFVSGKFNQFQQSAPYHGFIQAFQKLIHFILTESDQKLEVWREKLIKAVYPNGQLLCDVIPELRLIIGEQAPAIRLNPSQEEVRFQTLLASCLQIFAQSDQPLVIFLDDLQWADAASLKFLEFLYTDINPAYLLIIGAYRDNEINTLHPLTTTLERIQKSGKSFKVLPVRPLTFEAISLLIRDSLHASLEDVQPLAELVYRKTQGNPFFTIRFLQMLYQEGLINFDPEQQSWVADIANIQKLGVSDNVADLLMQKMKKLPPATQTALKIGAAIGKAFPLELLASISNHSASEIYSDLWMAYQDELILQDRTEDGLGENPEICFIFQHDRIQQAAYQLIPESERNRLHYQIGRVLLEKIPQKDLSDQIIPIVNQLNYGVRLIEAWSEKLELAKLNLQAGEKAKQAAAFTLALKYFMTAKDLIEANQNYSEELQTLKFTIYRSLAICEYMIGQHEEAELAFDSALQYSKNRLEKADIYYLKNNFYISLGRYEDAIDCSIDGLALFDIHINLPASRASLIIEFLKLRKNFLIYGLEYIDKLPEIHDETIRMIERLYLSLSQPAFIAGKDPNAVALTILRIVNMTFKYGVSDYSVQGLMSLAVVFSGEGQKKYELALHCGLTALRLADRLALSPAILNGRSLFYCCINRFDKNIRENIEPLKVIAQEQISLGNITNAMNSLNFRNLFLFFSGEPLDFVEQEISETIKVMQIYKAEVQKSFIRLRNLVRTLKNTMPHQYVEDFNAVEKQSETYPGLRGYAVLAYYIFHSYIFYMHANYERAIEVAEKLKEKDTAGLSTQGPPGHLLIFSFFYQALARLAFATQREDQKKIQLPIASKIQRQLHRLAQICPANYLHMSLIISAEICRLKGQKQQAADLYEQAITQTRQQNFLQEQAVACELAAKFHLSIGHREQATFYMQEAYRSYAKWGCRVKMSQLLDSYPDLLANVSKENIPLAISSHTSVMTSLRTSSTESTTTEFELNTLMQAAQSLSEEVILEKLITKLMNITLTYAGADKSFLILKDAEGRLNLASKITIDKDKAALFDRIPIERMQNDMCLSVVHYVARSLTGLLLDDAAHTGSFTHDPYIIEKQPQSILCIPLLKQGKLIGLLYLENSLSKGAFSSQHLRILSLISSQMAISIENAFLYAHLEIKVEERAKKIKEMQSQLMQQERLASLGLLTAGIAHEVKNPLNFVINFANLSLDLVNELEGFKDKLNPQDIKEIEEFDQDIQTLKHNIETIHKQGRRADDIIQRMLAHSKSKATHITVVDIHKLIEEYVNLSYHGVKAQDMNLNVKLIKDFDPDIKSIEAVPEDIGRVILNLLNNAYYTVSRKTAEQLDHHYQPTIWIETKKLDESLVEIRIRDNGEGIPPELTDKIFTPFFTTKPPDQGTGLGLSLSYNIVVQEHHGILSFETRKGEGTEFKIVLPIQMTK